MTDLNEPTPKHAPIAVSPDEAARLAGIGRTTLLRRIGQRRSAQHQNRYAAVGPGGRDPRLAGPA